MVPLMVSVKDSDGMATDDLLGSSEINWENCVKEPGKWAINTLYELQGPPDIKGGCDSLGFIYLQV